HNELGKRSLGVLKTSIDYQLKEVYTHEITMEIVGMARIPTKAIIYDRDREMVKFKIITN
ncbi:hypothetical protein, partial [Metallosphaera sp.]|uniref:hypothetical protein n=1 Tax=Metallosphaera sp. TaxID=2020860 RepID=UPI00316E9C43